MRTDPRPMRVFVYCIAADIEAPPEGTGYARAETPEEAVALVGHPEAKERRPLGLGLSSKRALGSRILASTHRRLAI